MCCSDAPADCCSRWRWCCSRGPSSRCCSCRHWSSRRGVWGMGATGGLPLWAHPEPCTVTMVAVPLGAAITLARRSVVGAMAVVADVRSGRRPLVSPSPQPPMVRTVGRGGVVLPCDRRPRRLAQRRTYPPGPALGDRVGIVLLRGAEAGARPVHQRRTPSAHDGVRRQRDGGHRACECFIVGAGPTRGWGAPRGGGPFRWPCRRVFTPRR